MSLDLNTMRQIVREVVTTRPDEIDCTSCFDQLDRFAELALAGRDAASVLPLVQDHLDHCTECREEFEALYEALHALG